MVVKWRTAPKLHWGPFLSELDNPVNPFYHRFPGFARTRTRSDNRESDARL